MSRLEATAFVGLASLSVQSSGMDESMAALDSDSVGMRFGLSICRGDITEVLVGPPTVLAIGRNDWFRNGHDIAVHCSQP